MFRKKYFRYFLSHIYQIILVMFGAEYQIPINVKYVNHNKKWRKCNKLYAT